MNFKSFKTLALVGSAVIGLGLTSGLAFAADNDDVDASITTSTTITATAGAVMDFGVWLIGIPTGNLNSSTLVMNPQTGAVTPTTGGGHQLIVLPGAPAFGTVTVTLPAGADGLTLQMSHDALTPALGAGLTLSNISYYNPDTPAQTGVMTPTTQYPITILDGATGSAVRFGGTITADTATPTDGAHGETFNVAFAY
jgi:hypothetical protein